MWRTILILFLCLRCSAATYYVTTNGLAGNSGAINSPLSLVKATALTSPAVGGDLVYIRGGVYTNNGSFSWDISAASSANPITFQAYPGERAIIDAFTTNTSVCVNENGSNVVYRGIEFVNSLNKRDANYAQLVFVFGQNSKFINCILHDGGAGFGTWSNAINSELYGNIIYYNGYFTDHGHGHAIYAQNPSGNRFIRDNIMFSQEGEGLQCYTQSGLVNGIFSEGNISFINGIIQTNSSFTYNYEVGAVPPLTNTTFRTNISWFPLGLGGNSSIGYIFGATNNGDVVCNGNYFAGGAFQFQQWTNPTVLYNTWVIGPSALQYQDFVFAGTQLWNSNLYYSTATAPFLIDGSSKTYPNWQAGTGFDANSVLINQSQPATNFVFVRTNNYEPGRAHVAIMNWQTNNNVSVNMTGLIPIGTMYTVRNVQDYFNPISTNTYFGGSISFPMTNLSVSTPINLPTPTNESPYFAAFVIAPIYGATNVAPSCSFVDVQNTINLSDPGDTVIIPAGTCDWQVNVLTTNNINILGIAGSTIIRNAITNNSDQSASACLSANAQSSHDQFIMSIGGLTFITAPSQVNNFFESGNVHIGGTSSRVRIYNCVFNDANNIGIGWFDCFGCIDHNYFAMSAFKQPGKIHHAAYGGGSNGDGAWLLPSWTNSYQEDASAVYVENNNHTNTSGVSGLGWDSDNGARVVYRSNILDRVIIGGHGTETTQRPRGSRLKDIYNNIIDEHGDSEAGHWRSGSGVWVSNTIANSTSGFTCRNYRMAYYATPWHAADGTNNWDLNNATVFGTGVATGGGTLTMTDNSQNWTVNQWVGFSIRNVNAAPGAQTVSLVSANTANTVTFIPPTQNANLSFVAGNIYEFRQVITVLDEVGRGQGNAININSPAWPNEALDPVYCWSNTLNGVAVNMSNGRYYSSVVGQEIVNGPNPNWVPFIYPHPLVSGLLAPGPPPGPGASQIARVTLLRVGNTKTGP